MATLEELGYEIIKHPIMRVRVQQHAGKWYVEYQRKPRYVLDRWWWFDDSIHPEFKDAYTRAEELSKEGGTKEIKFKEIHFDMKDMHP